MIGYESIWGATHEGENGDIIMNQIESR